MRVPDGITAQASGRPLAAGMLDSTGMQTTVMPDGCTFYKPLTVN